MKALTKEDIQTISLYIPYRVGFAPMDDYRLITRYFPSGIIENTVIQRWNEEDGELEDRSDISHIGNTDRPILYRLENMDIDHYNKFNELIEYEDERKTGKSLIQRILTACTPAAFLYALSHSFDLFGLIDAGKAIDGGART